MRHAQSRRSTSLCRLRRSKPSKCIHSAPPSLFSLFTQTNNGSHHRNSHPRHVRTLANLHETRTRELTSLSTCLIPSSSHRDTSSSSRSSENPAKNAVTSPTDPQYKAVDTDRKLKVFGVIEAFRCAHRTLQVSQFGLADEHVFATTQERQAPQQRVSRQSLQCWEGKKLTQVSLCRQCIQALDYAVGHSPINERRLSKDGQTLVEDTRSEQRLSRLLPRLNADPPRPLDIIRVLKEIVAEKNDDELFQNFLLVPRNARFVGDTTADLHVSR